MTDNKTFYGFSADPFGPDPDAQFFFSSETHGEALATLQYGISYRKGFILLLGEAGVGKTALMQYLQETPPLKTRVIYFSNSRLPFPEMLREILRQLDIPIETETKGTMIHSLYHYLIAIAKLDENVAIVVDSAEEIQLELLEEIRLLANLETGTTKLLQIVLVGRPELKRKISSNRVRQLKQRISVRGRLTAMTLDESKRYIKHRLKIAGNSSARTFTDEALSLIASSSKGNPLKINTLCSNALSVGCRLSEKQISAATINKVRRFKNILPPEKAGRIATSVTARLPRKMLTALVLVVFLAAAVWGGKTLLPPLLMTRQTPQTVTLLVEPLTENPADTKDAAVPAENAAPQAPATAPELKTSPAAPASEAPQLEIRLPEIRLPEIRIRETVRAVKGTNLSSLALRYYRFTDKTLIDHILKTNPDITNPHLIQIGQNIRIPEVTEPLLVIQSPKGRYFVHLRTFDNQVYAQRFQKFAASWAENAVTVPHKISSGETWHRVMAGPYSDAQATLMAIEKMKRQGLTLVPSREERQWTRRSP